MSYANYEKCLKYMNINKNLNKKTNTSNVSEQVWDIKWLHIYRGISLHIYRFSCRGKTFYFLIAFLPPACIILVFVLNLVLQKLPNASGILMYPGICNEICIHNKYYFKMLQNNISSDHYMKPLIKFTCMHAY